MLPLHPHDPPSAGPYRLLARLGEDHRTRSYLGAVPGRPPVRVRILRSAQATDPTSRSAFAHRVRSASGLGGPHVAAVLDADLDSPVPWAATERPLGTDLDGLVRDHGPLPTAALHSFALATAQGLAALHTAQRAHGALTPESVLLTGDRALLADPGLIPSHEAQDGAGGVFDPPEGGGTPAGDVFSWAAVLCFAASGVEGPRGLDRVPLQLRGAVDACLQENANLRPSAVDLVIMLGGTASAAPWPPELASVIDVSAVAVHRALPAEPAAPEPGGRGRFIGLAAGALVLTLVTATGAVWGYDRLFALPQESTADGGSDPTDAGPDDAACLDGIGFSEPGGWEGELNAGEAVFSPDGDVLALAGDDHGLSLWDWREGELLAVPAEGADLVRDAVFSPVGCRVSAIRAEDVEEAEREERPPYRLATTYDVPTGRTQDHLGAQPAPRPDGSRERTSVSASAFSPDGRLLALGTSTRYEVDRDDSIGVVDVETGELVRTFNDGESTGSLAFLDDTRLAGSGSDTITVWDVETGDPLQTVRNVASRTMATVPGRNQVLYVRNGEVVWRDLENDSELGAFPLDDYAAVPFGAYVRSLTPDAERGLVHIAWYHSTGEEDPADRSTIRRAHLWDVETGEDLLAGNEDPMLLGAAFHPEVIAGVGADGNVNIIDPDTLETVDVIG
ncbi:hypothetical protein GCM10007079_52830 [Nocardiopsis terrae]|uniref:WD40 repeat n=1 Tax=Nocardiopsis terrae TaxID=372655 RepID=A0ABR9HAI5_9ACTN|nr:hypothetical protein [Nocardiopsis terrae]MBE1455906.1 hypothetical protein [Nocardiopsis terrae]GHC98450.1 hypothetical protein GCM10007079_52830 [Nocardiopsis terrae]